jgi:hypothetical protein
MKLIELSNLQRDHLLEMIRKLFPDYKSIDFVGSCDFCLEGTIRLSKYEDIKAHWNNWVLIHWFEFCIIHLASKLDSYKTDSQLICSGQPFENALMAEHPIDYLYQEFLKIK